MDVSRLRLQSDRSRSLLSPEQLTDKVKGCIYASALGDALGLYTEMVDKATATSMWNSLGGLSFSNWIPRPHTDQFARGDWTDDTDLSLVLIDSFLETSVCDLNDIRRRAKHWLDFGYAELGDTQGIGTGSTITTSLNDRIGEVDPLAPAFYTWAELGNFDLGTSGAVMRTAPVAICYYRSLKEVVECAVNIGILTHADPRSVAACVAVDVAIAQLLLGDSPEVALNLSLDIGEQVLSLYTDSLERMINRASERDEQRGKSLLAGFQREKDAIRTRARVETFRECFSHQSLDSIPDISVFSRDYAYKILAVAIWTLRQTRPFEEVLLDIVKQGGDADTNAAVAGAVYGAVIGFHQLPPALVSALKYQTWLNSKVTRLLAKLSLPCE